MVALVAALLVPSYLSPARAITVPTTIARTLRLVAGPGAERVSFDIVPTHVAFSWRGPTDTGVIYRTVDGDGGLGSWTRAPEDIDAGSDGHHYSAVIEVDRPNAIEWKPIGRVEAMGPVTLDYLNTLDGPRETETVPASASAAAHAPHIVTRAEWGADESLKRTTGSCRRAFYPVTQLFVHHTAGTNFDQRPKATMRAIYWFHVVRRGWCDIGYNFVISPDGQIFEGRWARDYRPWEIHDSENVRGRAVAGAHVEGYNSGSVGVSMMGNYSQVTPPPAMRRSLAELLAWEVDRHDLAPKGVHTYRNPVSGLHDRLPYIAGHRDAGETECPGNHLYRALPDVRGDVAAVMGPGKDASRITLAASSTEVVFGNTVTLTGSLRDAGGAPIDGEEVRTYVREGTGRWRNGPTATTAPDGSFSMSYQPSATTHLVGVFDGDGETWGSESSDVVVKVAPALTLSPEGGAMDGAGISHYPPGTASIRFDGTIAPAHDTNVFVKIGKLQPDGTYAQVASGSARFDGSVAGNFIFDWSLPATEQGGTYRAYAVFRKDDDHARSVSAPVFVVVDP